MSTEADQGGIFVPGRDVRASRQPVIRQAMETFFDAVDPAVVQATLQQVLDADSGTRISTSVDHFVNPGLLHFNPFVSAIDVCQDLLLMNNSSLWRSLLVSAVEKDRNVLAGLAAEKPLVPEQQLLTETSERISGANTRLFGATLIFYTMAVVYGEHLYPNSILPGVQVQGDQTVGFTPNPRFESGREISRLFPNAAGTVDETIARLRTIFPANAASYDDIPAFRAIKAKRAFTNVTPFEPVSAVTCPGDGITGMLFTAYGNILAQPAYQQKLRAKFTVR